MRLSLLSPTYIEMRLFSQRTVSKGVSCLQETPRRPQLPRRAQPGKIHRTTGVIRRASSGSRPHKSLPNQHWVILLLLHFGVDTHVKRSRGSQPPTTISRICDSLRSVLEQKDLKKYVNSILTAYVVKSPPDHESGLAVLLRIRGQPDDLFVSSIDQSLTASKDTDPNLVEDAVKYIIFLVDADRLFDTALGMYDFSLVLMIAQHAQKVSLCFSKCSSSGSYTSQDPREYLPFLRELRSLDQHYQRFRIDNHLKRHEKALTNLSLAGNGLSCLSENH